MENCLSGIQTGKDGGIRGGFFKVLEKVQATTDLISPDVCVRDKYGLSWALRRGVTAPSKNMRIDKELRDAIHQWGKEANAHRGVARSDLHDVHSTLDAIAPMMLMFSGAL
jgi:hypothetical protein